MPTFIVCTANRSSFFRHHVRPCIVAAMLRVPFRFAGPDLQGGSSPRATAFLGECKSGEDMKSCTQLTAPLREKGRTRAQRTLDRLRGWALCHWRYYRRRLSKLEISSILRTTSSCVSPQRQCGVLRAYSVPWIIVTTKKVIPTEIVEAVGG